MTSRVLYLSENIFATVQNRLVFSIIRLNGASKKTDFEGNYLANSKRCSQSLYEGVNRKPLGAYREQSLDLTPSDLEPRYRGVKFPTFAVLLPAGQFRSNLSMLCHYGPPTHPVNFVLIGWTTASQFNKLFFNYFNLGHLPADGCAPY